jgi:RNA polymerase sigma-70 factor (ECF subfamily)
VAQEALIKALQQWPHHGVPANPAAWLTQVAKNLALDSLRREASLASKEADIARSLSFSTTAPEVIDDQLAMMFLCCHPEIPHDGGIALTLKTVCGFGAGEIARAFLIQETTAAQRIVRAKRLIREGDLKFELPDHGLPPERLDSVLESLYLMFNEGYASGGDELLRRDLCEEAIRLARLTAEHEATKAPECDALLALFLLQSARDPARVDERGDLFVLRDQDRSRWDHRRIAEGILLLGRSARGDRLTRYHLEAGIAAEHAAAPDFASTNWARIAEGYEQLHALNPSPVVALNRAVALAQALGPAAGLHELEKIEFHPALQRYHLLPSAMGALWREMGDPVKAARYFELALQCECSAPERRHLMRQLAELKRSS